MTLEERLSNIKSTLESDGEGPNLTVRELLSWFNAYRRGWAVVENINSMLAEYGLETSPYFDAVYIDSTIRLQKVKDTRAQKDNSVPEAPTTTTTTKAPENISFTNKEDILTFDDPTYRIAKLETANLEAAKKELIYVKPDNNLKEAITKMIINDYSQLPVMQSDKRGLKGVISWRSIGTKLVLGPNPTTRVADYMEPNYQLISAETSLFKALPIIIEHDYVLVENNMREVCGIVTASDLSLQFKQLAEPFLLVSEIENYIRQILSELPKEDIRKAKNEQDFEREIDKISNLTFGEYLRLLQNPDIWSKLNLTIDKGTFCDLLEKIKDIRNNIMHFDPDGLDSKSLEALRNFTRLLQTLRTIKAI